MGLEHDEEWERRLGAVDEKWRETARRRLAAILAYETRETGERLSVEELCRQAGLTRSAFHALVRRWKASGRDPVSLAPYAKRPYHRPRIDHAVVALLDERILKILAGMDFLETETVTRQVLADWPQDVPRPGLTFIRARVARARAHVAARRSYRLVSEPPLPLDRMANASRAFEALLIDHSAIEALVDLGGGVVTMPVVTVIIDLYSRVPLAVSIGAEPTPNAVEQTLGRAAQVVLGIEGAPLSPTIVMGTQYGGLWTETVEAIRSAGATLVVRRTPRLTFGGALHRLIGDRLGEYGLAPRIGHRAAETRVRESQRDSLPQRTLAQIEQDLDRYLEVRRAELKAALNDVVVSEGAVDGIETWRTLTRWARP